MMRAHLIQYDIAWEDKPANHAEVDRLVASARPARGDLVLLPEMFDTGFSLNVERTADVDGASQAFLSDLASRLGVWVQGGVTALGPAGRGLNRAVAFDPGGALAAHYDKLHPFSYGREPERFDAGERIATYPWTCGGDSIAVCPVICYDLRFPELFRHGLAGGAGVFAVGANWPSARTEHWRTLLRARAIENQAFVLGVNRCGSDPHLSYEGASLAVGPKGEVLAEGGGAPGVLTVPIDPEAVQSWRDEFPAWRDLRPDLLGGDAPEAATGR